jgi:hypothetical protein
VSLTPILSRCFWSTSGANVRAVLKETDQRFAAHRLWLGDLLNLAQGFSALVVFQHVLNIAFVEFAPSKRFGDASFALVNAFSLSSNFENEHFQNQQVPKFETKSDLLANTVDDRRNCRLIL